MERVRGQIYYDKGRNCLVYRKRKADSDFWDEQWSGVLQRDLNSPIPRRGTVVTNVTRKYLPAGNRVLEGGCGTGMNSQHLFKLNYDVTSLDWAERTIGWLTSHAPQIKPVLGDLRELPFEADSFDGYWSLGVIEHFYDGYQDLTSEMRRVIRSGGYLFITFPHMSLLRKLAARAGKFPLWDESLREEFYQFALDADGVLATLQESFKLVEHRPLLGLSGIEDMWPVMERPIQGLRDGGRLSRVAVGVLNMIAQPVTSHMALLVLKKK